MSDKARKNGSDLDSASPFVIHHSALIIEANG
jgi:hypothetical protein